MHRRLGINTIRNRHDAGRFANSFRAFGVALTRGDVLMFWRSLRRIGR